MVKCPRCEHVVDETKRTTCPICFTPLQAPAAAPPEPPAPTPPYAAPPLPGQPVPLDAPPLLPRSAPPPGPLQMPQPLNQPQPLNRPAYTQAPPPSPPPLAPQPLNPPTVPQAPQPLSQGGIPGLPNPPQTGAPPLAQGYTAGRVTLTGEPLPMEAPAPGAGATTIPGAPTLAMGGGLPPLPPLLPRPELQAPPRRPEKAGSGITTTRKRKAAANTTLGTIVSAVVLALITFGGIGSYLRADTLAADNTPKAQAEKFFAALAKLDWKGIYATSDLDRERYPTEAAFVREMQAKMDAQPQAKEILSTLFRNMRVRVGEPAVEEDTATVPVTLTLAAQGREASSTTEIEMRKVNGVWKREPEDSDPDSVIGVPGIGGPEDAGGMGTTGDPGGLPASPDNP
ncbi:MAG TPA: hypothetical protein VFB21_25845 [Chthonomonadaceae bacterium]|nr:hypothetical protein [Chthonomonadaceae bacterium]